MNTGRVFTVIFLLVLCTIPMQTAKLQHDPAVLPDLPGRIAFIGTDFNIHSLNFENQDIDSLTADASGIRRYQWPTWSKDNKLAYFCCDPRFSDMGDFTSEIYISADGVSTGGLAYHQDNESVIYAYWSPQNCIGDNCSELVSLNNQLLDNTLTIMLLRDSDGVFSYETLAAGAPFYYSWSPNGNQMVWHRNNQRLDVYDLATREVVTTYDETPGMFYAPAWSPVDDRILIGALDDESNKTDLIIKTADSTQTLAEDLDGLVSFVWSPDGNYVAYRTANDEGVGQLNVVDAVSGEIVSQSSIDGVIAFFWSPDSTKVAYVTLFTPPGTFNISITQQPTLTSLAQQDTIFAWTVLNIASGTEQRFGGFIPNYEMAYLLTYFDQFHQSHHIWSPDSTHIVYSELAGPENDMPVISILNTTQPDTVPFSIANGTFAIWSFN